jgi:hypothetical protein
VALGLRLLDADRKRHARLWRAGVLLVQVVVPKLRERS